MTQCELFDIQPEGNISLIRLKDPWVNDTSNLEAIEDGLRDLVNHVDQRLLLLDFTEVQVIVSRMINSLLLLVKRVRAEGGQVHLCCLDAKVERVLKAMKLDRVFDMHLTTDTGLEELRAFDSHCRTAQFA